VSAPHLPQPAPPTAPGERVRTLRLDSLTGLRWWAAFGVFLHHMTNLAPLPVYQQLSYGNYGVMFFFVLSGFVLTWSAQPDVGATTFWVRRFARIYPAHLVALLVCIPVFYSFSPDPAQSWVKPFDIGILLLSVVLLQGWSRDPVILFSGNPAAWTLTCEAFFYALHPFLNRLLGLLRTRGALIAAVAVFAVVMAYRIASILWPVIGEAPLPLARVGEFALGMCIAHAMRTGWRPRLAPLVVYVVGAIVMLWLGFGERLTGTTPFDTAVRPFTNEIILLLCVALITTVAARDLRGARSLLRARVLVKLGDWSYAFYLIHATAVYAVLELVGKQPISWGNLGWYAVMLVVGVALAAALHYGVEKPFERRIRGAWNRRLARPVSA
jgi:peptidoglycan/LPS O-acetylase OafA/YrhL